MSAERSAMPVAPSMLIVRTRESARRLEPGVSCRVGRDPDSDIVLSDPRVSWHHSIVRALPDGWGYEDLGSTNGSFRDGQRVRQMRIDSDCTLLLGHPETGIPLTFSLPPKPDSRSIRDRNPTSVTRLPARTVRTIRIGRSLDNDITVPDLVVSRHHAELRSFGDGRYQIVDLGSHNGTFVNGTRITSANITESDLVSVGHATFRLVGEELREFIDTGDVSVALHDLVVRTPEGKVILDHVSFPIPERCLVAVIGPSGAGKSTLLGAVTGTRPATEGTVQYDNRDLYADYEELRHRIGLVPQEDILHTQLPTQRALRYAAELRFPGDTDAAERNRRVDEVMEELGLTARADTRIASLSGGQRKRVSVALELLTKPSLLFLDEPTSGLDPGLDKTVMELMRDLAHDGRTVIVVTHSVANLNVCDRLLVLVPGGRVAYWGPPEEGLRYFGKEGWAEVFQAFEQEPNRDWAADFRASPQHAEYVAAGLNGGNSQARQQPGPPGPPGQPGYPPLQGTQGAHGPQGAPGVAPQPKPAAPPPPQQSKFSQLGTLCRRYMSVIASERSYIVLLALLPVILGGLVFAIPNDKGFVGNNPDEAPGKLLVLIFAACFAGTGNAVRELVKERAIYRRERAAGLSAGVYLFSKVLVLGLITGLQAVVLVFIGLLGQKLPSKGAFTSPYIELILVVGLLAVVSMLLGLLVSAAVDSSEKTLPLLVVISLAQLVLCSALVRMPDVPVLNQVSWLAPSRWGTAAAAVTLDYEKLIQKPGPPVSPDPLWKPELTTWFMDMGILALLGLIFIIIAWRRLERLRPGRTGRKAKKAKKAKGKAAAPRI